MSILDKINYYLILAEGPTGEDIKNAGWQTAGLILGWVLIAGAILGLIATVWYFIVWLQAGYPPGNKKSKFIGSLSAFIFCIAIGATLLSTLGVETSV